MKKIALAMITTLLITTSIGSINADAKTIEKKSTGKSFSKAWSSTAVSTANETFKYGYNKALINEDYTHTYNYKKTHYAYVKNSGKAVEKKAGAKSYAKAEIAHKSGTVYYRYKY
ncbi:hypothetical protein EOT00_13680 [Listeria seeligeri]|uniref:mediterrocin family bacteriocin n=1 Tax=Listeria seeligeri TaxID=1640 RepID=UPI00111B9EB4|nr:hypothetical protein [Listeria seeligeri]QDA75936.1 hypothetical protein EOT00_13680 [Listeria seeligeri]